MNNEENGFKLFCNYLIDQINSSPKHNPSKFIERVKIVIDQINSNKKIDCKIFDLTSAQSELAIRDWEEKEINSSKYNEITVDGSQLMYEMNVEPIINYRNEILDKVFLGKELNLDSEYKFPLVWQITPSKSKQYIFLYFFII